MGKKIERIGEERLNNQGCLMKIVEYNNADNIIVEFQDKYKAKVNAVYSSFCGGSIRNPYYKSVCGIGMIGAKYLTQVNDKNTKEYNAWGSMLARCFDNSYKKKHPAYQNATCCEEWLLYENFYEWLHSQENFDKWINGERWAIDKDILVKGNKIYSPNTCCLVPQSVNCLFLKNDCDRGEFPIGVKRSTKGFRATYSNKGKNIHIGTFSTPEKAFQAYKKVKEFYIKQVAQEEYDKGNITERCYNAMMKYEIEITD